MSQPDPAEADFANAMLTAGLSCAFGGAGVVACRRIGPLRALFHRDAGTDTPVGFVLRGAVYLKAGPDSVTRYIARGMWPYLGNDVRQPLRGYWRLPPEVVVDDVLLADWAARALHAARQFGRRPARRRAPGTPALRPRRKKSAKPTNHPNAGDDR